MDVREKVIVFGLGGVFLMFMLLSLMTSCTLSFTNVMTHGTATDVVDSTPTSDVKTDADIKIPAPL